MMFETTGQANIFLAMVYAGLAVGVCYDLLRLLRRLLKARRLLTGALDLLFWVGASGCAAWMLAVSGEGSLRVYALMGCASGLVLYLLGLSALMQFLINQALKGLRSAQGVALRGLSRFRKQKGTGGIGE